MKPIKSRNAKIAIAFLQIILMLLLPINPAFVFTGETPTDIAFAVCEVTSTSTTTDPNTGEETTTTTTNIFSGAQICGQWAQCSSQQNNFDSNDWAGIFGSCDERISDSRVASILRDDPALAASLTPDRLSQVLDGRRDLFEILSPDVIGPALEHDPDLVEKYYDEIQTILISSPTFLNAFPAALSRFFEKFEYELGPGCTIGSYDADNNVRLNPNGPLINIDEMAGGQSGPGCSFVGTPGSRFEGMTISGGSIEGSIITGAVVTADSIPSKITFIDSTLNYRGNTIVGTFSAEPQNSWSECHGSRAGRRCLGGSDNNLILDTRVNGEDHIISITNPQGNTYQFRGEGRYFEDSGDLMPTRSGSSTFINGVEHRFTEVRGPGKYIFRIGSQNDCEDIRNRYGNLAGCYLDDGAGNVYIKEPNTGRDPRSANNLVVDIIAGRPLNSLTIDSERRSGQDWIALHSNGATVILAGRATQSSGPIERIPTLISYTTFAEQDASKTWNGEQYTLTLQNGQFGFNCQGGSGRTHTDSEGNEFTACQALAGQMGAQITGQSDPYDRYYRGTFQRITENFAREFLNVMDFVTAPARVISPIDDVYQKNREGIAQTVVITSLAVAAIAASIIPGVGPVITGAALGALAGALNAAFIDRSGLSGVLGGATVGGVSGAITGGIMNFGPVQGFTSRLTDTIGSGLTSAFGENLASGTIASNFASATASAIVAVPANAVASATTQSVFYGENFGTALERGFRSDAWEGMGQSIITGTIAGSLGAEINQFTGNLVNPTLTNFFINQAVGTIANSISCSGFSCDWDFESKNFWENLAVSAITTTTQGIGQAINNANQNRMIEQTIAQILEGGSESYPEFFDASGNLKSDINSILLDRVKLYEALQGNEGFAYNSETQLWEPVGHSGALGDFINNMEQALSGGWSINENGQLEDERGFFKSWFTKDHAKAAQNNINSFAGTFNSEFQVQRLQAELDAAQGDPDAIARIAIMQLANGGSADSPVNKLALEALTEIEGGISQEAFDRYMGNTGMFGGFFNNAMDTGSIFAELRGAADYANTIAGSDYYSQDLLNLQNELAMLNGYIESIEGNWRMIEEYNHAVERRLELQIQIYDFEEQSYNLPPLLSTLSGSLRSEIEQINLLSTLQSADQTEINPDLARELLVAGLLSPEEYQKGDFTIGNLRSTVLDQNRDFSVTINGEATSITDILRPQTEYITPVTGLHGVTYLRDQDNNVLQHQGNDVFVDGDKVYVESGWFNRRQEIGTISDTGITLNDGISLDRFSEQNNFEYRPNINLNLGAFEITDHQGFMGGYGFVTLGGTTYVTSASGEIIQENNRPLIVRNGEIQTQGRNNWGLFSIDTVGSINNRGDIVFNNNAYLSNIPTASDISYFKGDIIHNIRGVEYIEAVSIVDGEEKIIGLVRTDGSNTIYDFFGNEIGFFTENFRNQQGEIISGTTHLIAPVERLIRSNNIEYLGEMVIQIGDIQLFAAYDDAGELIAYMRSGDQSNLYDHLGNLIGRTENGETFILESIQNIPEAGIGFRLNKEWDSNQNRYVLRYLDGSLAGYSEDGNIITTYEGQVIGNYNDEGSTLINIYLGQNILEINTIDGEIVATFRHEAIIERANEAWSRGRIFDISELTEEELRLLSFDVELQINEQNRIINTFNNIIQTAEKSWEEGQIFDIDSLTEQDLLILGEETVRLIETNNNIVNVQIQFNNAISTDSDFSYGDIPEDIIDSLPSELIEAIALRDISRGNFDRHIPEISDIVENFEIRHGITDMVYNSELNLWHTTYVNVQYDSETNMLQVYDQWGLTEEIDIDEYRTIYSDHFKELMDIATETLRPEIEEIIRELGSDFDRGSPLETDTLQSLRNYLGDDSLLVDHFTRYNQQFENTETVQILIPSYNQENDILSQDIYIRNNLGVIETFDPNTRSWIKTPYLSIEEARIGLEGNNLDESALLRGEYPTSFLRETVSEMLSENNPNYNIELHSTRGSEFVNMGQYSLAVEEILIVNGLIEERRGVLEQDLTEVQSRANQMTGGNFAGDLGRIGYLQRAESPILENLEALDHFESTIFDLAYFLSGDYVSAGQVMRFTNPLNIQLSDSSYLEEESTVRQIQELRQALLTDLEEPQNLEYILERSASFTQLREIAQSTTSINVFNEAIDALIEVNHQRNNYQQTLVDFNFFQSVYNNNLLETPNSIYERVIREESEVVGAEIFASVGFEMNPLTLGLIQMAGGFEEHLSTEVISQITLRTNEYHEILPSEIKINVRDNLPELSLRLTDQNLGESHIQLRESIQNSQYYITNFNRLGEAYTVAEVIVGLPFTIIGTGTEMVIDGYRNIFSLFTESEPNNRMQRTLGQISDLDQNYQNMFAASSFAMTLPLEERTILLESMSSALQNRDYLGASGLSSSQINERTVDQIIQELRITDSILLNKLYSDLGIQETRNFIQNLYQYNVLSEGSFALAHGISAYSTGASGEFIPLNSNELLGIQLIYEQPFAYANLMNQIADDGYQRAGYERTWGIDETGGFSAGGFTLELIGFVLGGAPQVLRENLYDGRQYDVLRILPERFTENWNIETPYDVQLSYIENLQQNIRGTEIFGNALLNGANVIDVIDYLDHPDAVAAFLGGNSRIDSYLVNHYINEGLIDEARYFQERLLETQVRDQLVARNYRGADQIIESMGLLGFDNSELRLQSASAQRSESYGNALVDFTSTVMSVGAFRLLTPLVTNTVGRVSSGIMGRAYIPPVKPVTTLGRTFTQTITTPFRYYQPREILTEIMEESVGGLLSIPIDSGGESAIGGTLGALGHSLIGGSGSGININSISRNGLNTASMNVISTQATNNRINSALENAPIIIGDTQFSGMILDAETGNALVRTENGNTRILSTNHLLSMTSTVPQAQAIISELQNDIVYQGAIYDSETNLNEARTRIESITGITVTVNQGLNLNSFSDLSLNSRDQNNLASAINSYNNAQQEIFSHENNRLSTISAIQNYEASLETVYSEQYQEIISEQRTTQENQLRNLMRQSEFLQNNINLMEQTGESQQSSELEKTRLALDVVRLDILNTQRAINEIDYNLNLVSGSTSNFVETNILELSRDISDLHNSINQRLIDLGVKAEQTAARENLVVEKDSKIKQLDKNTLNPTQIQQLWTIENLERNIRALHGKAEMLNTNTEQGKRDFSLIQTQIQALSIERQIMIDSLLDSISETTHSNFDITVNNLVNQGLISERAMRSNTMQHGTQAQKIAYISNQLRDTLRNNPHLAQIVEDSINLNYGGVINIGGNSISAQDAFSALTGSTLNHIERSELARQITEGLINQNQRNIVQDTSQNIVSEQRRNEIIAETNQLINTINNANTFENLNAARTSLENLKANLNTAELLAAQASLVQLDNTLKQATRRLSTDTVSTTSDQSAEQQSLNIFQRIGASLGLRATGPSETISIDGNNLDVSIETVRGIIDQITINEGVRLIQNEDGTYRLSEPYMSPPASATEAQRQAIEEVNRVLELATIAKQRVSGDAFAARSDQIPFINEIVTGLTNRQIFKITAGYGKSSFIIPFAAALKAAEGKKVVLLFKQGDIDIFKNEIGENLEFFQEFSQLMYGDNRLTAEIFGESGSVGESNIIIADTTIFFEQIRSEQSSQEFMRNIEGASLIADEAHVTLMADSQYITSKNRISILNNNQGDIEIGNEIFEILKISADISENQRFTNEIRIGLLNDAKTDVNEAYESEVYRQLLRRINPNINLESADISELSNLVNQQATKEQRDMLNAFFSTMTRVHSNDYFHEISSDSNGNIISNEIVPRSGGVETGRQFSAVSEKISYELFGRDILISANTDTTDVNWNHVFVSQTDRMTTTQQFSEIFSEIYGVTGTPELINQQVRRNFGLVLSSVTSDNAVLFTSDSTTPVSDNVAFQRVHSGRTIANVFNIGMHTSSTDHTYVITSNMFPSNDLTNHNGALIQTELEISRNSGRTQTEVAIARANGDHTILIFDANGEIVSETTKSNLRDLSDYIKGRNYGPNAPRLVKIYEKGRDVGTDLWVRGNSDKIFVIGDVQSTRTDIEQARLRDRGKGENNGKTGTEYANAELIILGTSDSVSLDSVRDMVDTNQNIKIKENNLQGVESALKDFVAIKLSNLGLSAEAQTIILREWQVQEGLNSIVGDRSMISSEQYLQQRIDTAKQFFENLISENQISTNQEFETARRTLSQDSINEINEFIRGDIQLNLDAVGSGASTHLLAANSLEQFVRTIEATTQKEALPDQTRGRLTAQQQLQHQSQQGEFSQQIETPTQQTVATQTETPAISFEIQKRLRQIIGFPIILGTATASFFTGGIIGGLIGPELILPGVGAGIAFGSVAGSLAATRVNTMLFDQLRGITDHTVAIKNNNELELHIGKDLSKLSKDPQAHITIIEDAARGIRHLIEEKEAGNLNNQNSIVGHSHLVADNRPGHEGELNPLIARALENLGITDINTYDLSLLERYSTGITPGITRIFSKQSRDLFNKKKGGEFTIDISTPEQRRTLLDKINPIIEELDAINRGESGKNKRSILFGTERLQNSRIGNAQRQERQETISETPRTEIPAVLSQPSVFQRTINRVRTSVAMTLLGGLLSFATPAEAQIQGGVYIVRSGDTLNRIAQVVSQEVGYEVTVGDLVDLNRIQDPNQISIGQEIQFPTKTYTVRPGDTLGAIARSHGIRTSALQKANGITDPTRLQVEQVLIIPDISISEAIVSERTISREQLPATEQIFENNIDFYTIVQALIFRESSYNQFALSVSAAGGYGQLVIGTARDKNKLGLYINEEWESVLRDSVNRRRREISGWVESRDGPIALDYAVRQYAQQNNLNPNTYQQWLPTIDERFNAEINVESSARYLAYQYSRFSEINDPNERIRYAIAAYKEGRGNVNNALYRRLRPTDISNTPFEAIIPHLRFSDTAQYVREIMARADDIKQERLNANPTISSLLRNAGYQPITQITRRFTEILTEEEISIRNIRNILNERSDQVDAVKTEVESVIDRIMPELLAEEKATIDGFTVEFAEQPEYELASARDDGGWIITIDKAKIDRLNLNENQKQDAVKAVLIHELSEMFAAQQGFERGDSHIVASHITKEILKTDSGDDYVEIKTELNNLARDLSNNYIQRQFVLVVDSIGLEKFNVLSEVYLEYVKNDYDRGIEILTENRNLFQIFEGDQRFEEFLFAQYDPNSGATISNEQKIRSIIQTGLYSDSRLTTVINSMPQERVVQALQTFTYETDIDGVGVENAARRIIQTYSNPERLKELLNRGKELFNSAVAEGYPLREEEFLDQAARFQEFNYVSNILGEDYLLYEEYIRNPYSRENSLSHAQKTLHAFFEKQAFSNFEGKGDMVNFINSYFAPVRDNIHLKSLYKRKITEKEFIHLRTNLLESLFPGVSIPESLFILPNNIDEIARAHPEYAKYYAKIKDLLENEMMFMEIDINGNVETIPLIIIATEEAGIVSQRGVTVHQLAGVPSFVALNLYSSDLTTLARTFVHEYSHLVEYAVSRGAHLLGTKAFTDSEGIADLAGYTFLRMQEQLDLYAQVEEFSSLYRKTPEYFGGRILMETYAEDRDRHDFIREIYQSGLPMTPDVYVRYLDVVAQLQAELEVQAKTVISDSQRALEMLSQQETPRTETPTRQTTPTLGSRVRNAIMIAAIPIITVLSGGEALAQQEFIPEQRVEQIRINQELVINENILQSVESIINQNPERIRELENILEENDRFDLLDLRSEIIENPTVEKFAYLVYFSDKYPAFVGSVLKNYEFEHTQNIEPRRGLLRLFSRTSQENANINLIIDNLVSFYENYLENPGSEYFEESFLFFNEYNIRQISTDLARIHFHSQNKDTALAALYFLYSENIYLPGETMREIIAEALNHPVPEIRDVALDLARGLPRHVLISDNRLIRDLEEVVVRQAISQTDSHIALLKLNFLAPIQNSAQYIRNSEVLIEAFSEQISDQDLNRILSKTDYSRADAVFLSLAISRIEDKEGTINKIKPILYRAQLDPYIIISLQNIYDIYQDDISQMKSQIYRQIGIKYNRNTHLVEELRNIPYILDSQIFQEDYLNIDPSLQLDAAITIARLVEKGYSISESIEIINREIEREKERELMGENIDTFISINHDATVYDEISPRIGIHPDFSEMTDSEIERARNTLAFSPEAIKEMALRGGVSSDIISSFVGPEQKLNALNNIAQSVGKTTIYFNGHGGPTSFWLAKGTVGDHLGFNIRESIHFRELAESLFERLQSGENLDNVNIIFDQCYAYDYATELYQYLHNIQLYNKIDTTRIQDPDLVESLSEFDSQSFMNLLPRLISVGALTENDFKTELPTIVTVANRRQLGWGRVDADEFYISSFFQMDIEKQWTEGPLTLNTIFNTPTEIQDVAVFVPTEGTYYTFGSSYDYPETTSLDVGSYTISLEAGSDVVRPEFFLGPEVFPINFLGEHLLAEGQERFSVEQIREQIESFSRDNLNEASAISDRVNKGEEIKLEIGERTIAAEVIVTEVDSIQEAKPTYELINDVLQIRTYVPRDILEDLTADIGESAARELIINTQVAHEFGSAYYKFTNQPVEEANIALDNSRETLKEHLFGAAVAKITLKNSLKYRSISSDTKLDIANLLQSTRTDRRQAITSIDRTETPILDTLEAVQPRTETPAQQITPSLGSRVRNAIIIGTVPLLMLLGGETIAQQPLSIPEVSSVINFVNPSTSRQIGTTHAVERGVVRLEISGREVTLSDGETIRALEYLFNRRPVPFADRLILRNIQEKTDELKEEVDELVASGKINEAAGISIKNDLDKIQILYNNNQEYIINGNKYSLTNSRVLIQEDGRVTIIPQDSQGLNPADFPSVEISLETTLYTFAVVNNAYLDRNNNPKIPILNARLQEMFDRYLGEGTSQEAAGTAERTREIPEEAVLLLGVAALLQNKRNRDPVSQLPSLSDWEGIEDKHEFVKNYILNIPRSISSDDLYHILLKLRFDYNVRTIEIIHDIREDLDETHEQEFFDDVLFHTEVVSMFSLSEESIELLLSEESPIRDQEVAMDLNRLKDQYPEYRRIAVEQAGRESTTRDEEMVQESEMIERDVSIPQISETIRKTPADYTQAEWEALTTREKAQSVATKLGITLTEAQLVKIERIHELGEGFLGSRNLDGTYNKHETNPFTLIELIAKARGLADIGLTAEQRRAFIEYGVVGKGTLLEFIENFLEELSDTDKKELKSIISNLVKSLAIEWDVDKSAEHARSQGLSVPYARNEEQPYYRLADTNGVITLVFTHYTSREKALDFELTEKITSDSGYTFVVLEDNYDPGSSRDIRHRVHASSTEVKITGIIEIPRSRLWILKDRVEGKTIVKGAIERGLNPEDFIFYEMSEGYP